MRNPSASRRRLLGRRDQHSGDAPNGSGVAGACAHGGRTTFAFVLKKGFAPDRGEGESNERHPHREEKTSQPVRSRLLAYQFAIHGYSSGWENVGPPSWSRLDN